MISKITLDLSEFIEEFKLAFPGYLAFEQIVEFLTKED